MLSRANYGDPPLAKDHVPRHIDQTPKQGTEQQVGQRYHTTSGLAT